MLMSNEYQWEYESENVLFDLLSSVMQLYQKKQHIRLSSSPIAISYLLLSKEKSSQFHHIHQ
ncbi:hypothetical protein LINPERHAP1_LOCUS17466 [Linum perenne]